MIVFIVVIVIIIGGIVLFKSNNQSKTSFKTISVNEAKQIMEDNLDVIIVDVRNEDEYNSGHIKNAILLPLDNIKKDATPLLPDKEKEILVYCHSGRRSKIAANELVELGYQNIKDFGGIIKWDGPIVK